MVRRCAPGTGKIALAAITLTLSLGAQTPKQAVPAAAKSDIAKPDMKTDAKETKALLDTVETALGAKDLRSIQYTGTGFNANLGQNVNPSSAWPRFDITAYTRTINFQQQSSKEDLTRIQGNNPVQGGGAPIVGEQKQNAEVSGAYAWNTNANGPVAQFGLAREERKLQIWLTPQGFIAAAKRGNGCAVNWDCEAQLHSKMEGGKKVNVITAVVAGKYKVDATLDEQNRIAMLETKFPNPVLGDMPITVAFSDYKDFAGVKFPTKIVQTQGPYVMLDLRVTDVKPNAPADLSVPDGVRTTSEPKPQVDVQLLSDGIWYLTGGSHHSLVVEFKDYMAIIEAPLDEARSQAVLTEAKHLVINKPVKYLINTHAHFDHSGGLRAYVADGVTIVTHAINKAFYDQAFKNKATIEPDKLSKNPKPATYITVTDKYVLTDGSQKIELYATKNDNHNEGMLLAYLPSGKILVEADEFNPPAGEVQAPTGAPPAAAVTLYDNIQRLKLDVAKIAPIHGRLVTMADFQKFLGKTPEKPAEKAK